MGLEPDQCGNMARRQGSRRLRYVDFLDDASGKAKQILIQVKSGKVGVSQIRDLKGAMEREGAAIGVFITLQEPPRPMVQ